MQWGVTSAVCLGSCVQLYLTQVLVDIQKYLSTKALQGGYTTKRKQYAGLNEWKQFLIQETSPVSTYTKQLHAQSTDEAPIVVPHCNGGCWPTQGRTQMHERQFDGILRVTVHHRISSTNTGAVASLTVWKSRLWWQQICVTDDKYHSLSYRFFSFSGHNMSQFDFWGFSFPVYQTQTS